MEIPQTHPPNAQELRQASNLTRQLVTRYEGPKEAPTASFRVLARLHRSLEYLLTAAFYIIQEMEDEEAMDGVLPPGFLTHKKPTLN